MSRTLTEVLVERERLLARCEQQRARVAAVCRGLAGPASVLDRMAAGGRYLARHPVAVFGLMAAVALLRGRRLLGMAAHGIAFWRLGRRLRSLLQLLQR